MTAVHHFYDDLMRISSEMINYRGTVSSLGSVCLAACCYREARVHDRRRTTGSRCSGGTAAVDSCPLRRTEARRCRLPGCGSARPSCSLASATALSQAVCSSGADTNTHVLSVWFTQSTAIIIIVVLASPFTRCRATRYHLPRWTASQ